MATDLVINIASQFLGKKSFADAEKATKKLTGSVKNLGRTLGVTLSAAAILAYGKASVKAASEDIKAQRLLANTLKNVGLAYAAVDAEGFITKMQSQTGVLDDQLRPAFAQLAGVTGSVAKTEKLLALAFDVSSGSTLDYASSVDLLAQAYVGNKKALKQLDLGYTQAELAAMSFDQIQQIITDRFAGSGKAALDTYIGQMSLLAVATNNAKEIIGTSLLGAIDSVGGSDGIDNLGKDIENAAKSLANFIDSIVYLKEQIATIPGAGIVKGVFGAVGNVLGRFSPQRAAELLKEIKGPQPFSQPMSLANQDTGRAALAASKKAELDAIKRNKELAKLANAQAKSAAATAKAKKDQAALDKAALALGKGQDVFNLDAIQIQAALLAKQDEINKLGVSASDQQRLQLANDLVRLTIKQDMLALEDAIANKDVAAATRLAAKLDGDLKILGTLQNQSLKLTDIKNILDAFKPKELIDQNNLNMALKKIEDMLRLLGVANAQSLSKPATSGALGVGIPVGDYVAPVAKEVALSASTDALLEYAAAATERANAFALLQEQQNYADYLSLIEFQKKLGDFGGYSSNMNTGRGYGAGSTEVVVTIEDKTSGLIEVVQNAVQQNNRFGNNLNFAGALPV
jgi:hypothetical protein